MTGHCGRAEVGTGWGRRPSCAEVQMKDASGTQTGACFILGNSRGEWWDGREWSPRLAAAERYAGEPDPDRQAREAAAGVERLTGLACNVYYVSAAQASEFFGPAGGRGSG